MRNLIILVFLCPTLISCGQPNYSNFPTEINTTKLSSHINIKGTRIYIVPPEGFSIWSSQPGIRKGKTAYIQTFDLGQINFYKETTTFTKENLEKSGAIVYDFKMLKLNGDNAKLAFMEGGPNTNTKVYILIFGDSTFSAKITGVFPDDDSELRKQVMTAMLSIYYDKSIKINPFESLKFSLNDNKSIFKYAGIISSFNIYSINGIKKSTYKDEPYLAVFNLPLEGYGLIGVANSLTSNVTGQEIKNVNTDSINNFPSYKREVYGIQNGKSIVIFQHIVLVENKAVVMQGQAFDHFDMYIKEFENLSKSITKD
jgi:hypothetical protein